MLSTQKPAPPDCPCGAPRVFEAQLLPTVLFELQTGSHAVDGGDGMDWGFVALYTCAQNCHHNLTIDGIYGYEEVYVEDLRAAELRKQVMWTRYGSRPPPESQCPKTLQVLSTVALTNM